MLEILICPNCKGKVEYRERDQVIACIGDCRYVYPVVDGIPHMLVDEAQKPSDAGGDTQ